MLPLPNLFLPWLPASSGLSRGLSPLALPHPEGTMVRAWSAEREALPGHSKCRQSPEDQEADPHKRSCVLGVWPCALTLTTPDRQESVQRQAQPGLWSQTQYAVSPQPACGSAWVGHAKMEAPEPASPTHPPTRKQPGLLG